jgi:hypothetical protein
MRDWIGPLLVILGVILTALGLLLFAKFSLDAEKAKFGTNPASTVLHWDVNSRVTKVCDPGDGIHPRVIYLSEQGEMVVLPADLGECR